MTTYLSRDDILSAQDFRTDEVKVPEWGGSGLVLVRELSAAEAERVGFAMADSKGNINLSKAEGMAIRVVALGVIDESYCRVFTRADVKALGGRSYHVIKRIAQRIMQLTGLAPEPEDLGAIKTVMVYFAAEDDIAAFAELVGQKITDETEYIWYPKQERTDPENEDEDANQTMSSFLTGLAPEPVEDKAEAAEPKNE